MKLWSYVILFSVLVGLGIAGYFYFDYTQKQIVTLATNLADVKTKNDIQDKTIAVIQKSQLEARKIADQVFKTQIATKSAVADLESKFKKMTLEGPRDIGNLAQARPNSIERIINDGTEKVFRCMEISTGNKLTDAERANYEQTGKISDCPGTVIPR